MLKQHCLNSSTIQHMFIEWHSQVYGWEYCVFINNAWKFSASLKNLGLYQPLSDYLLIECDTKKEAETLFNNMVAPIHVSIWHNGKVISEK